MSLYKRGDTYWYEFVFEGTRYRRSAKVKNLRKAEEIERAFRTQLAKGEVGIETPKPAPTLADFSQQFIDFIETRHANKPSTVSFYANRFQRLLEWRSAPGAFHETTLDKIDEKMIARYISARRKKVGIVAVNRELATLRRILHLAQEWKIIQSVPKIRLLPGEAGRDFVLDHATETAYLKACMDAGMKLLHDVVVTLLDSALRPGEAIALQWPDVHLEPAGSGRYGWVQVRDGKSTNARRTVPLLPRAVALLTERKEHTTSEWVFPGDDPKKPILGTTLAHWHAEVCRPIEKKKRVYKFPADFVLHSCRHTALTRLGEAGADAFTILKVAGHSSVTVSQRYVHPTGETVQLAFDRLEILNQRALAAANG